MNTELTQKDEGRKAKQCAVRAEVAILMCTYNGAAYLREQLESFTRQSLQNWTLYVSDDASTDSTRSILAEYQQRWGGQKMVIFEGPCEGFGRNFLSLLHRPQVQARYYAFSDQDDLWFDKKLERSVMRLEDIAELKPSLYCSRTRLVDATGKIIGFSPRFTRPPSFKNALVQSIAGANTMLINNSTRELLLRVPNDATIVAHDWLTYLIVTACGGKVVYDDQPTLDYRQHGGNLIGANVSISARLARVQKMLSGRFADWNDSNIYILKALSDYATDDARRTLIAFDSCRHTDLLNRFRQLRRSGVYRQTMAGRASLLLAAWMGRI